MIALKRTGAGCYTGPDGITVLDMSGADRSWMAYDAGEKMIAHGETLREVRRKLARRTKPTGLRAAPISDAESATLAEDIAPNPYDAGALLRATIETSGVPRADVVRRIADAEGRNPVDVSRALTRAMGRPDADARTVRAVCRALGLRVVLVPNDLKTEAR